MKFQYKIFLLFMLSVFFTLVTTVSFVFSLLQKHNALYENPRIEQAIKDFFTTIARDETPEKAQTLFNTVTLINREYVKGKILKKDILVSGISSLLLFLFFQTLIILFLIFFIIKVVTSQMNIIYSGVRQIEQGNRAFRFPVLKGYEFKAIGDELNSMLVKLMENEAVIKEQSKLAGWQEVSSFLSHQLKNPLTAIALAGKNIELCGQQEDKAELVRANLTIIEEESVRLTTLLSRLKELSTFPTLSKEKLNINQLIREISQHYSAEQAVFDLRLGDIAPLSLDRQLMEQVFLNLFTNSIEAGEKGKVTISVTSRQHTDKAVLEVSDSVTNLPPGITGKIFIPKFTTKKGGMGLGLTFVKKIILMHGGEISVNLSALQGLVFTFSLPLDD